MVVLSTILPLKVSGFGSSSSHSFNMQAGLMEKEVQHLDTGGEGFLGVLKITRSRGPYNEEHFDVHAC